MNRSVFASLALLVGLTASTVGGAQPPRAPAAERGVTRLVLLESPTRWDAWAAVVTPSQAPASEAAVAPQGQDAPASDGAASRRLPGAPPPAGTTDRPVLDGPPSAVPTVRGVYDAPPPAGTAARRVPDAESIDEVVRIRGQAAATAASLGTARLDRLVTDEVLALGGTIIARYDTALTGLLVRLPAGHDRLLAGLPGVRRVTSAPLVSANLWDSVPGIGARRVVQELGIDGAGAVIAIADTGIDYTHAAFGGAGTEAAYAAAAGAAERIDDKWDGRALFPSARVIAGWDFAGPLYDPDCTPVGEASGSCSASPQPDPDPLDRLGHGTIVAGVAGGEATGPVGPGVAPGAALVPLKIFGRSGTTELLLSAVEWVVEANMGDRGRPHIDVLNMSLGLPYGGHLLADEGVIRRAVEAGVVVVASAGNDGDRPYVLSGPAAVPEALAVASNTPPERHSWDAKLVRGGETLYFGAEAIALQGWSPDPRSELNRSVVDVGRGCPGGSGQPPDPYPTDLSGAVAMFEMAWGSGGPDCTVDRQARRAQDAGAVGALMATGLGVAVASRLDAQPTTDIPVWMVNDALETAIEAGTASGRPMQIELQPLALPEVEGVTSSFSSRGPGRAADLKPDLTAPGSGIFSAAVGQGWRGISSSGTSLAAPHVAGTAALVWAASRAAGRKLSAADVAAILITSADPDQVYDSAERHGRPPLARMGAGGLDAWSAVQADTVTHAGPLASLNLGFHALAASASLERTLDLTNLSTSERRYELTARYRVGGTAGLALAIGPDRRYVTIAPGVTEQVGVAARVYPNLLGEWSLTGGARVSNSTLLTDAELDGWIEIRALDAGNDAPTPPMATLRVPFYLLARRAATVEAAWTAAPTQALFGGPPVDFGWTDRPAQAPPRQPSRTIGLTDTPAQGLPHQASLAIGLTNTSPFAGSVELFSLATDDPLEPDLPPKVDLDEIGVRAMPDGSGGTIVTFLLHSRGIRSHPMETQSLVELDTNLDGQTNYFAYTADEELLRTKDYGNGKVIVAFDEPGGGPFGSPITRYYAGVDLHSRYTLLPIRIEDTGLTPSTLAFNFRVQLKDLVAGRPGDRLPYDQAPDGARWLHFDARRPALVPTQSGAQVGAAGQAAITVAYGPGLDPRVGAGLLALFPDNPPGPGDLALIAVTPRTALYLPRLLSGH